MPDIVRTVGVALDRGGVGFVERFRQYLRRVVSQWATVHVDRLYQRAGAVGELRTARIVPRTLEGRLALRFVATVGVLEGRRKKEKLN